MLWVLLLTKKVGVTYVLLGKDPIIIYVEYFLSSQLRQGLLIRWTLQYDYFSLFRDAAGFSNLGGLAVMWWA